MDVRFVRSALFDIIKRMCVLQFGLGEEYKQDINEITIETDTYRYYIRIHSPFFSVSVPLGLSGLDMVEDICSAKEPVRVRLSWGDSIEFFLSESQKQAMGALRAAYIESGIFAISGKTLASADMLYPIFKTLKY